MKHTVKLRHTIATVTLFGIVAAPLVGSALPASARPASHDSARRYQQEHRRTLVGIVSRHYADDVFELRNSDGHTYTVRTTRHEPLSLSVGDKVQVTGAFNGHTFVASTLKMLRNDDKRYVNFSGRVLSVSSREDLKVRADNGVVLNVDARGRLPRAVSKGDLVRVTGQHHGNTIRAAKIEILRNR